MSDTIKAGWDPQKYTELRKEEDRILALTTDLRDELLQKYESDEWSDSSLAKYTAGAARHGVLMRELDSLRGERRHMEFLKPKTATERASSLTHSQDALDRWLRHGVEALDTSERDEFLPEKDPARSIPAGDITKRGFCIGGLSAARKPRAPARRLPGPSIGVPSAQSPNGQLVIPATTLASALREHRGPQADWTSTDTDFVAVLPRTIESPVERMAAYGGHLRWIWRFTTATGNSLRFPGFDRTSQEGAYVAQAAASTTLDLPDPTNVEFTANTLRSKWIKISRELVTDETGFDVGAYAEASALERLGRATAKATMSGNGTGQPTGLLSEAAAGITTDKSTSITGTEIHDLAYEINLAYRERSQALDGMIGGFGEVPGIGGGMIGYMVSDDAEKAMRNLADADGRPLWRSDYASGSPMTFAGWPYIVSANLESVAAGKVPILFGAFGYYALRTVSMVTLYTFWDSQTADTNEVWIQGYARNDAKAIGAIQSSKCEAIAKLTMKT